VLQSHGKLCPGCGRTWPHSMGRCTCGYQWSSANMRTTTVNPPRGTAGPMQTTSLALCPSCGANLPVGSPRCPSCGMILMWQPPVQVSTPIIGGMWVCAGMMVLTAAGNRDRQPGQHASSLPLLFLLGALACAIILVNRRHNTDRTNGWVVIGISIFTLVLVII
jgi:hypothetical protein